MLSDVNQVNQKIEFRPLVLAILGGMFLTACASQYEMNKRVEYKRLDPPCAYEDFVWEVPVFIGCKDQPFPNGEPVEELKHDPQDKRPVAVQPVV